MTNDPFTPLTDAQWEQFLNEVPGRRASFAKDGPDRLAAERARINRVYALRGSRMVADLVAVAELAQQLRDAARAIGKYRRDEAARILARAGLPLPDEFAIFQGADGYALEEPRAACLRLAKAVEEFLATLDTEARSFLPSLPRTEEVSHVG